MSSNCNTFATRSYYQETNANITGATHVQGQDPVLHEMRPHIQEHHDYPQEPMLTPESMDSCEQGSETITSQPGTERFESFVRDVLGQFVPQFTSTDKRDTKESRQYHTSVNLAHRPTVDIERQFINLDDADREYLRLRGIWIIAL